MDDLNNDYDVSQLRWWRCTAVDANSQIHTSTVEIDPDRVYQEFRTIRQELRDKGLQFVEAKPISAEELLAAKKLQQFKTRKRVYARGLTGRHYSPFSHWSSVLAVVLWILLALWLAYRHLST